SAVTPDVLAPVPFLSHVPAPRLEDLVRSSFLRRRFHGDKIVQQGEYGHTLFVLIDGVCEVEASIDNGKVLKLTRLDTPGAHFGELAILGRTRRTATVTAVGPTVLLEIEKTKL